MLRTRVHARDPLYASHPGLLEMNPLTNRPEFSEHSSAWLYQACAALHPLLMNFHPWIFFITWCLSSQRN